MSRSRSRSLVVVVKTGLRSVEGRERAGPNLVAFAHCDGIESEDDDEDEDELGGRLEA